MRVSDSGEVFDDQERSIGITGASSGGCPIGMPGAIGPPGFRFVFAYEVWLLLRRIRMTYRYWNRLSEFELWGN